MTENEFAVMRLDKGKRYGELLYISDSLQACNKAAEEFKSDGTCQYCKVLSYEQIIKHGRMTQLMTDAKFDKIRKRKH